MTDLGAWVRRLIGRSPPTSPPDLWLSSTAPLPVLSSEFDRKIDAMIAATETSISRAESLVRLAEDNNAFAAALHGHLRLLGGNQFFSPLSIRTALLMAYFGAKGDTAAQIREALRVSMPDDVLCATCAAMVVSLSGAGGAYELAIANSVWSQIGVPLESAFVDVIEQHFGGSWNLVDFRSGSEAARASINRWVSDRTKGRIADVLAPGFSGVDTRLVLVNAVYFKGKWTVPFDRDRTCDEPFFREDGGEVRVPLMHQTEQVRYLQGPNYQAVTLAYQGTDLSLLVILPERRDGLKDLETALSAAMMTECLKGDTRRVELFLPRFTVTWGTVELREALTMLGMRLAFTQQGDFSGVNGRAPPDEESLFVSAVLHKAFVDVNEEGTEAAAASAVEMMVLGPPPSHPPPVPIFRRTTHSFLPSVIEILAP